MSHRIQCCGGPKNGWFVDTEDLSPFLYFNVMEPIESFTYPELSPVPKPMKRCVYKLMKNADSGDLWYVYEETQ